MTAEELQYEWKYRYDERLGILECFGTPTPEQNKIAREEADAHIAKLKAESN